MKINFISLRNDLFAMTVLLYRVVYLTSAGSSSVDGFFPWKMDLNVIEK